MAAHLIVALALGALPHQAGCPPAPPSRPEGPVQRITRPRWVGGVLITEYYPVPERWFTGRAVTAPGLAGRHRIDWLYSSRGVTMEGDGIGLDGRRYHVAETGDGGWVNAAGSVTAPCASGGWDRGRPVWRSRGLWRNAAGRPTFPLRGGGWSNGRGRTFRPMTAVRFAAGPSLPLRPYASLAVDPRLIPVGSRVYIPAYRDIGRTRGWFRTADVGGAILGRHVDVYRPPPATPADTGRLMRDERIYVVPPGTVGDPTP